MESMEITKEFWKNRSVFITGHTGFKGGWLSLWLTEMGAQVHGYSLEAPTNPNFFTLTKLRERIKKSTIGDINDYSLLLNSLKFAKPSIIIHMAAQPLVRESFNFPLNTFKTNIIGTVNLFEAARKIDELEAIINVTTDKCYENLEKLEPYNENDRLGGNDPYSNSKACSELVSSAYRTSFFEKKGVKLASVRAGNVIGGGDWSNDRLIPDFFRAFDTNKNLLVRYPKAMRPWQHVLEPLSGYILLAEKLVNQGNDFAEPWNFGPDYKNAKTVSWVLSYLKEKVHSKNWKIKEIEQLKEANILLLDSSKAKLRLNWEPRWTLETALDKIVDWHLAYKQKISMSDLSIDQINSYVNQQIK